jgi:hypothetical protein
MNIIRTTAIELSTIPAIAYKQKLSPVGAGLKILGLDQDAVGVFTIDRQGGSPQPYGKMDAALFPDEAVDEALELTQGLPYSARGKIKVSVFDEKRDQDDVTLEEPQTADMVNSDEYNAIVDRYRDEKGKLNYPLMNKDFIQFAAKSKTVGDMAAKRMSEDDILVHILRNRAAYLADKKDSLTEEETRALIETLDEIDPRSAFKELKNHIRRMLTRK